MNGASSRSTGCVTGPTPSAWALHFQLRRRGHAKMFKRMFGLLIFCTITPSCICVVQAAEPLAGRSAIVSHPYTGFADAPLELVVQINVTDYVKPRSSIFKAGLVNITEVVTRLYGPGITDPPSLDLVESILAVEQYWYTGLGMETTGSSWAMIRSAPALKYPRDASLQGGKRSFRKLPAVPQGHAFQELNYVGLEMRLTLALRANSTLTWVAGHAWLTYMDVVAKAIARLGFPKVYCLPLYENRVLPTGLPLLAALPPVPMTAYSVLFHLEGPHLVPFTVGKQTALQAALSPLLMRYLSLVFLRIEKIDEYFNVRGQDGSLNVTLLVAVVDNVAHLPVDLVFSKSVGDDWAGILASGENGFSHFQLAMAQHGLQLSVANVLGMKNLTGGPPLTLSDRVKQYALTEEERNLANRQLLFQGAIGVLALMLGIVLLWGKLAPVALRTRAPLHLDGAGLLLGARTGSDPPRVQDIAATVEPVPSPGPPEAAGQPAPDASAAPTRARGLQEIIAHRSSSMQSIASNLLRASWEADIIPNEELKILKKTDGSLWVLGQGSYGQVFKGERDGAYEVAIKLFNATGCTEEEASVLMNEISLLRSCRHSNIVQFQGVSFVADNVWLVMEFMSGGNLYTALAEDPTSHKWYGRGAKIALDIAKGLAYLHSRGVLHLDLKSPNVLLSSDGTAKIADVGLSKILQSSRTHASNLMPGSFTWTAPEVLVYGRASYKADIFSLGMILWELVTGEVPRRAFIRDVKVPEECPPAVEALFKSCMQQDPSLRPTAKDVIRTLASIMSIEPAFSTVVDPAPLEDQEVPQRLREAALQDQGPPSPPEGMGSGNNLNFGVSMPGDPLLKSAKGSREASEDLSEAGRASQGSALSCLTSSASFNGLQSQWSLRPLEKPPPPFSISSAERILRGEALTSRVSADTVTGFSSGDLSSPKAGPAYKQLPRLKSAPLHGNLETEHLRAPSGLLRSGPNPFADPEKLSAANPFCGPLASFNPFAAVSETMGSRPSLTFSQQSRTSSLNTAPASFTLDKSFGEITAESNGAARHVRSGIGGLSGNPSVVALSSVNSCDETGAVSLHPSLNGYDAKAAAGESNQRGLDQAWPVAELHEERVDSLERVPEGNASGDKPFSDVSKTGPTFPMSVFQSSSQGEDPEELPDDESGALPPGELMDQLDLEEELKGVSVVPKVQGPAHSMGLPHHHREGRMPLNRASAPVEGSLWNNPFKEFAKTSFGRVTQDSAEVDGIPSPTSSRISIQRLGL